MLRVDRRLDDPDWHIRQTALWSDVKKCLLALLADSTFSPWVKRCWPQISLLNLLSGFSIMTTYSPDHPHWHRLTHFQLCLSALLLRFFDLRRWFYKQTALSCAAISELQFLPRKHNGVINSILAFNCPVKRGLLSSLCVLFGAPETAIKLHFLWS